MDLEVFEAYKKSWLALNESQQKNICKRFGIEYSNKEDDNLINQVAIRQQQSYDTLKRANSLLKKRVLS